MDILKKILQVKPRKIFLIFLCATLVPSCRGTEEYQREIFLGPRNYNPHPYEHQLASIQDPGPVTFPRGEDDDEQHVSNRYNIVTLNKDTNNHPVDNHPYSKVARKIKNLISRKYSNNRDNQIDSDVYDALAEQGAKVLTHPAEDLQSFADDSANKNNYAFAYKVLDKGSGDDFSHQQRRNAKATNGEYRVKLPDGRVQVVSYIADKNGYNADVTYELDPNFTHQNLIQTSDIQNIHQYDPQSVNVEQVPVRKLKQGGRQPAINNNYQYAAEEREQQLVSPLGDHSIVVLEQAGPTQVPVKYVDIAIASPAPPRYPRVKIYTNNNLQTNYVSSTAATPVSHEPVVRYTSTPVPPVKARVEHAGDRGIFAPVISSTFTPLLESPLLKHRSAILRADPSGKIGGSEYHQTLAQENELPEGIYIVGKSGKRK